MEAEAEVDIPVPEQIRKINKEIEKVAAEIDKVAAKIEAGDILRGRKLEDWSVEERSTHIDHITLREDLEDWKNERKRLAEREQGLRKEEEQLREEKFFLLKKQKEREDLIIKKKARRKAYQNVFRLSFIKALYNEGKGVVVSSEYFNQLKGSRKYSNSSHPELMEECRNQLKSLGWEPKLLKFEHIEIDCVLRCHIKEDPLPEFAEPANILLPPTEKLMKKPHPFAKKISDSEIEIRDGGLPEPNCYILVEITSNPENLEQKMIQLEKDLCFLLLRHQKESESPTATIESIISYAFLVLPFSHSKDDMDILIRETITNKEPIFPLLFRLYELGRFARYFTPKGANSRSLRHQELSLKLMFTLVSEAKKFMPSNPIVAGAISEFITELNEGLSIKKEKRRSK